MSTLPRGSTVRRDAGLYGYERALRRAGLAPIAGVDEAGRGACAGPLVAAAAILPEGKAGPGPRAGRLQAAHRQGAGALLRRRSCAGPSRGRWWWSRTEECDRLGMHVANVEALRRSLARLELRPAYVLTDGFPVDGLEVPGLAMWKGDRVAACISAASVIAKVTRDRIMCELHEQYPAYDFATHKGYITEEHAAALDRARPEPGAPDAVRQRAACRRDHRRRTPQSGAPAGAVRAEAARRPLAHPRPRNPRHLQEVSP